MVPRLKGEDDGGGLYASPQWSAFTKLRHSGACLPSDLFRGSQGSIPETFANMRSGFVYIMTNKKGGTLYVGVTSDLAQRVWDHKNGNGSKFTARYGCKRLVWFEEHELVTRAINREKTIKKWPRQWKINAIEAINPDWNDLRPWLF